MSRKSRAAKPASPSQSASEPAAEDTTLAQLEQPEREIDHLLREAEQRQRKGAGQASDPEPPPRAAHK